MYDGCFGLNRRPFPSVPQADHYVAVTAIEGARATMARCIQRGEGAGLVVGPSGTGKSLLCLLLAEQFRRSFQIALLSSGRLGTRRALFQAILYELGRPYRGMDEGELRLAVVDYLTTGDGSSRGLVLLVDEAHTLPLRSLEEIRLLTNLARGGQPLVRLMLAGGPVLEERFASPKLDSFSQRLAARCYLETLNRTETQHYIQSQVDGAGGLGSQLFSDEACQSVFQATGGVPRLINQVCDHALVLAYVAGRSRIEPADIEEAWSDLQQLPTPWNGKPQSETETGGVIEFGALDEGESGASTQTPALRVAMDDDAAAPAENEANERICRIERLLVAADDDFEPAGTIGPEVELRFEDAHPFRESFEHEEVVADRYAAAAAVISASAARAIEASNPTEPPPVVEDAETIASDALAPCCEPFAVEAASDDRELAGVGATFESTGPASGEPMPHREYRRLFAKLRRG
jgi:type II secretory pathway predicted ATPase ExeA